MGGEPAPKAQLLVTVILFVAAMVLFSAVFVHFYFSPGGFWSRSHRKLLISALLFEASLVLAALRVFLRFLGPEYLHLNNGVVFLNLGLILASTALLWFEASLGTQKTRPWEGYLRSISDVALFWTLASLLVFYLTGSTLFVRTFEASLGFNLLISIVFFRTALKNNFASKLLPVLVLILLTAIGFTILRVSLGMAVLINTEMLLAVLGIFLGLMAIVTWPRLLQHREKPANFMEDQMALMGFTPREKEIASLIAQGQSSREIAKHLGTSEKTVRNHLSNMYAKAEVRNRVELMLSLSPVA